MQRIYVSGFLHSNIQMTFVDFRTERSRKKKGSPFASLLFIAREALARSSCSCSSMLLHDMLSI